jgi:hypothetical protein
MYKKDRLLQEEINAEIISDISKVIFLYMEQVLTIVNFSEWIQVRSLN